MQFIQSEQESILHSKIKLPQNVWYISIKNNVKSDEPDWILMHNADVNDEEHRHQAILPSTCSTNFICNK